MVVVTPTVNFVVVVVVVFSDGVDLHRLAGGGIAVVVVLRIVGVPAVGVVERSVIVVVDENCFLRRCHRISAHVIRVTNVAAFVIVVSDHSY